MSTVDLDDALTRAQRGEHEAVCAELRDLLADPASSAADRLPVMITLGTAEYYAGDYRASIATCGRAADLADELGATGQGAYVLSVRASSWIELGETGPATDDLVGAELLLTSIPTGAPILDRIRRSLAGSYGELEMFEVAVAHMGALDPESTSRVADTINSANLHLRWARYLQRVSDSDEPDDDRRDHLLQAAADLQEAAALIENGPQTWAALVDKMRRETAAQLDPATGIAPLQELIAERVDTGLANTTAVSLATLVTALRRLGRLDESAAAGRQAMTLIDDPRIYAETVVDVLFAVHRTHRAQSVPGAGTAASFLTAAADEQAQLRQERVDAHAARLSHELRRQELADLSDRVLRDPLTGLRNRRALESWFVEHPHGPALLAVIDLDNFKSINDTFGHGIGDTVLSRFADALHRCFAPQATVVRFGGDEFVIAATADTESALPGIAARFAEQIRSTATDLPIDDVAPGQRLSASVGVHTATTGEDARAMLHRADRRMYDDKSAGRADVTP